MSFWRLVFILSVFHLHICCALNHAISPETADAIVEEHNNIRKKVLPLAAYMVRITYDKTLEDMALKTAMKCRYGHSSREFRKSNLNYKYVGENLYQSWSSGFDERKSKEVIIDAIKLWGEEEQDYNLQTGFCGKECGHYTQIIWADTASVGCAHVTCNNNVQLVFCEYGPGGNIIGVHPFAERTSSSECPSQKDCLARDDGSSASDLRSCLFIVTLMLILFKCFVF